MKKILATILLATASFAASAQLTGNLGLTSDYRFRGVSQTQNAPAVQGGIDYAHKSGFYVGNWNSSVSSQVYTNGSGVESDLYAGFKKEVYKGITVDIGSYNYFYPRATTSAATGSNFDTYEGYIGVGYKDIVTAKYSQTLGNGYFGTANARGTNYSQVDAKLPVAKSVNFVAHYGRTNVANSSTLDYNDINAGVTYVLPKALNEFELGVKYYTNTSTSTAFETANTVNGQKNYKNAVVVSVTKTFN
jgi:uncharacterized protein (TIGR02001 family)